MSDNFGERLNQIRTSRKVTLDQLAFGACTSKSAIWGIENGTDPQWGTACKIADALGISIHKFRLNSGLPPLLVPVLIDNLVLIHKALCRSICQVKWIEDAPYRLHAAECQLIADIIDDYNCFARKGLNQ